MTKRVFDVVYSQHTQLEAETESEAKELAKEHLYFAGDVKIEVTEHVDGGVGRAETEEYLEKLPKDLQDIYKTYAVVNKELLFRLQTFVIANRGINIEHLCHKLELIELVDSLYDALGRGVPDAK